jgi:transposase-like protein
MTVTGAKLTLGVHDRVLNGVLYQCVIKLPKSISGTAQVLNGVRCEQCHVLYTTADIEHVVQHVTPTKSIEEIARLLGLQHRQVNDIIKVHVPEYFKARQLYKLQQTLDIDAAIAVLAKQTSVVQACSAYNVNPTTFRARVRKYKEHGIWPR